MMNQVKATNLIVQHRFVDQEAYAKNGSSSSSLSSSSASSAASPLPRCSKMTTTTTSITTTTTPCRRSPRPGFFEGECAKILTISRTCAGEDIIRQFNSMVDRYADEITFIHYTLLQGGEIEDKILSAFDLLFEKQLEALHFHAANDEVRMMRKALVDRILCLSKIIEKLTGQHGNDTSDETAAVVPTGPQNMEALAKNTNRPVEHPRLQQQRREGKTLLLRKGIKNGHKMWKKMGKWFVGFITRISHTEH